MKFRTGLIVGIAIGYAAATWLRRDDPVIVTDPSASQGRAGRMISSSSRRVAARAQGAGLVALRRARGTIQSRLGEEQDAAWV